MSTDLNRTPLERPTTRHELAGRLLTRTVRLRSLLGTIPLATELQLLKRDLARGHDMLRAAGETNFLSVIPLVASALACLTWKQYTPEVVDALRQAFAAGTQAETFTASDYDAVQRPFTARGIRTATPTGQSDAHETG